MAEILINNTHGKDDLEPAALALAMANTALNSGY